MLSTLVVTPCCSNIVALCYEDLVNCYAIVTDSSVMLVDTFFSRLLAEQAAQIGLEAALKLRNSSLKDSADNLCHSYNDISLMVANTHSHWDHSWGNGAFIGKDARYPAPILASQACADFLSKPETESFFRNKQISQPDLFSEASITLPSTTFTNNTIVLVGNLEVQFRQAPGHSEDQYILWIPQIRAVLAADAIEDPIPWVGGPGKLSTHLADLNAIQSLKPAMVLGCHTPISHNLDLLNRNIEYLESVKGGVERIPIDKRCIAIERLRILGVEKVDFEEFSSASTGEVCYDSEQDNEHLGWLNSSQEAAFMTLLDQYFQSIESEWGLPLDRFVPFSEKLTDVSKADFYRGAHHMAVYSSLCESF